MRDALGRGETAYTMMAGLGLSSTLAAILLGQATGYYEQAAQDEADLHGRRHRWAGRALASGGIPLGGVLLPGAFVPPLLIFSVLCLLNGAVQVLIAILSSTLLAEHTVEAERGRACIVHHHGRGLLIIAFALMRGRGSSGAYSYDVKRPPRIKEA